MYKFSLSSAENVQLALKEEKMVSTTYLCSYIIAGYITKLDEKFFLVFDSMIIYTHTGIKSLTTAN